MTGGVDEEEEEDKDDEEEEELPGDNEDWNMI